MTHYVIAVVCKNVNLVRDELNKSRIRPLELRKPQEGIKVKIVILNLFTLT